MRIFDKVRLMSYKHTVDAYLHVDLVDEVTNNKSSLISENVKLSNHTTLHFDDAIIGQYNILIE